MEPLILRRHALQLPATHAKIRIVWTVEGKNRSLTVFPMAEIKAGRNSTKSIVCAELTDDVANLEKSLKISSHHLTYRYLGGRLELVDPENQRDVLRQGKSHDRAASTDRTGHGGFRGRSPRLELQW